MMQLFNRFWHNFLSASIPIIVCMLATVHTCDCAEENFINKIHYTISSRELQALPPCSTNKNFLIPQGQELFLGNQFARELDLYRAVTAFKRAHFLALAAQDTSSCIQAEYSLALAYYLGGKYRNCIENFEGSNLETLTPHSPYYRSLLLMLFDSYLHTKEYAKASNVLRLTQHVSPELSNKLTQYQSIVTAAIISEDMTIRHMEKEEKIVYDTYKNQKKSPFRAGLFNALLPGAGYVYIGQVQSGITSFLLNALFIAASVQFFREGQTAAGIITTGFECGWYFGGIKGAHQAAQQYNTRLYTQTASGVLNEQKLFPVLLLDIGF